MSSNRLLAIYDLIARHEREGKDRGLLCSVAAEFTNMDGAGIVLSSPDAPLTNFCTSDPSSLSLMDFEIVAGEGPYTSARDSDVAVDGFDHVNQKSRWPVFSPMAADIGVKAVFGFPVRLGTARLGAMSLYRYEGGDLTEDQYADCYLMASVIGHSILTMQSSAEPGELSQALQQGAMFDFAVHQAAGMVAVQASIPISDALVVIQSHAFSSAAAIADVAVKVISRQIRYTPSRGLWLEG